MRRPYSHTLQLHVCRPTFECNLLDGDITNKSWYLNILFFYCIVGCCSSQHIEKFIFLAIPPSSICENSEIQKERNGKDWLKENSSMREVRRDREMKNNRIFNGEQLKESWEKKNNEKVCERHREKKRERVRNQMRDGWLHSSLDVIKFCLWQYAGKVSLIFCCKLKCS